MRIAFISTEIRPGGGETNLLNLITKLSFVHNIYLVCPPSMATYFSLENISVLPFDFPSRTWFRHIPIKSKFSDHIVDILNNCDIIHAYSVNALPFLSHISRPKIWTCHGYWEVTTQRKALCISSIVDRIIYVSQSVYDDLHLKFKYSDFHIIPLGQDLNQLVNKSEHISLKTLREIKVFCCDRDPIILTLARFQPIKGQFLLMLALMWSLLKGNKYIKNSAVMLVGTYSSFYEKIYYFFVVLLARMLSFWGISFKFFGYTNQPHIFIQHCNFVVIPSVYESFGMVAIESLALGRPLVGPQNTGVASIVPSDQYGLLFKPLNIFSLCKKIESLSLSYPSYNQTLLAQRAHLYSIDNQVCLYLKVYKASLANCYE